MFKNLSFGNSPADNVDVAKILEHINSEIDKGQNDNIEKVVVDMTPQVIYSIRVEIIPKNKK